MGHIYFLISGTGFKTVMERVPVNGTRDGKVMNEFPTNIGLFSGIWCQWFREYPRLLTLNGESGYDVGPIHTI